MIVNNLSSSAKRNTENALDWIIGEYYNCIQDGNSEDIPENINSVINEIYVEAVNGTYESGYASNKKTNTRFSGKEAIIDYIKKLMKEDSDTQEIADVKGWDLNTL